MPEFASKKESHGMITLSWNKENPAEIASAKKTFIEYTRKGWLAFTGTSSSKKRQIFSFNPEFGEIQLVPIVHGG